MGRQGLGAGEVNGALSIPPPPPGFRLVDDIPPPPPGFRVVGGGIDLRSTALAFNKRPVPQREVPLPEEHLAGHTVAGNGAGWPQVVKDIPGMVRAGLASGVAGAQLYGAKQLEDFAREGFGLPEYTTDRIQEQARGVIREAGQDMAPTHGASTLQRGVQSGLSSAAQQLPWLALGLATRNPGVALGAMGGVTAAQKYGELEAAGNTEAEAASHALGQGITEVVTELGPTGFLLKFGGPVIKHAIGFMVREVPGEIVAQLEQGTSDYVAEAQREGNPVTLATYWEGFKQASQSLPETVIATIVGGGVQVGAVAGANRLAEKVAPAAPPEDAPLPPPGFKIVSEAAEITPGAPAEVATAPQQAEAPQAPPAIPAPPPGFTVVEEEVTPEALTKRIAAEPELRASLKTLADQAGWTEIGGRGREIRPAAGPPEGYAEGRNQWLPRHAWWLDRMPGTEAEYRQAVAVALAGRKLGVKQLDIIRFLTELHDGAVRFADLDVQPEDFAGEIIREDIDFVSLAAEARQYESEDVIERLLEHPDDAHVKRELDAIIARGTQPDAAAGVGRVEAAQGADLFGADQERQAALNRRNAQLARKRGEDRAPVPPEKAPPGDLFREQADAEGRVAREGQADIEDIEPSRGVEAQAGATYVPMMQAGVAPETATDTVTLGTRGQAERTVPIPKKPLRREHVMRQLEQAFNVKIYQGAPFKMRTVLGYFRPKNFEVRVKAHGDLEVTAHEVFHWLDRTYGTVRALYHRPEFRDELKGISYDAKKVNEGFAEFGRLYMTQENEAAMKAPRFYDAFVTEAARLGILGKLNRVQETMHAWYRQGAEARALSKIGKPETPLGAYLTELSDNGTDRLIAAGIDYLQAAKVIERTLTGTINDATISPYKSLRLLAGGNMIANQFVNTNTLNWKGGDLVPTGQGLVQVLQPVADVLPEAMGYFVGRRAQELRQLGKENLLAPDEIRALLALPDKVNRRADIQKAFDDYQAYVRRLLDFAQGSGILNGQTRQLWEQIYKNYVPFFRVVSTIGAPDVEQSGGVFKRLTGGTRNLNDILENMVQNTQGVVRAGLRNVAKRQIYKLIESKPQGQRYAVRIGEDVKPVTVGMTQIAEILKSLEANARQQGGQVYNEIAQALNVINSIQTGKGESVLADLQEQATFYIGHQKPGVPDKDFYLDHGKPVWFQIGDPLLWDMVVELNTVKPLNLAEEMLSIAKRTLTRGVTIAPTFQIRNLIRDTGNAMTLAKNQKRPLLDVLAAMKDVYTESSEFQDYLNNGGGFGFSINSDTRKVKLRLERVKHAGKASSEAILDTPSRLLEWYDVKSQASELANRLAEFKRAKEAGLSSREAVFRGREVSTDFGMRGNSSLYRIAAMSLPFWSARMQGLYRIERELFELNGKQTPAALRHETAVKYALRSTLFITLPSLLLYLVNKDEDWYQEQNDAVRDLYWLFKSGDHIFAIPKPFETGMLFGTMAERMWQRLETQNSKEMMEALRFMLVQTFSMDGLPQLVRPVVDLSMNKDFRGSPIIPERLKDVEPSEQFTPYTTALATAAGKKFGVSPIKLEYLVRNYFGYMGGYALFTADALLGPVGGERAERALSDYPLIDAFVRADPARSTEFEQSFYDMAEAITETVATVRKMKADGRADDLAAYLGESEQQQYFAMQKAATAISTRVAAINAAMRLIRFDKSLSGAEKRRQLDDLQRQKNQLFRQVVTQLGTSDLKQLRDALEWKPKAED